MEPMGAQRVNPARLGWWRQDGARVYAYARLTAVGLAESYHDRPPKC
jgi:hypothetical protein